MITTSVLGLTPGSGRWSSLTFTARSAKIPGACLQGRYTEGRSRHSIERLFRIKIGLTVNGVEATLPKQDEGAKGTSRRGALLTGGLVN